MHFLDIQLHVAVLDPVEFAKNEVEQKREHSRKDEADQDQSEPVHTCDAGLCAGCNVVYPAGVYTDLADKTACAHAACDRLAIHLQLKDAGGERTRDRGGQSRCDPDERVADDVRDL